jgi:DNA-binding LacI/PurR family transcriptional regulator
MSSRRISIKDVAREAGVSVTTVSHALNGKGRLNPDTRRHVQAVAERLGYRPNPAARSLVSGRTGLIAVMASLPSEPRIEFSELAYFTELIGAATGAAVDRDVGLVVAPPGGRGGFVWDRVPLDGVIVIDPLIGEPALPALRDRGIPFVTVGRDPSDDGVTGDAVVVADEQQGTCEMLDHLAAQGGERIGLFSVPPLNAFLADTWSCYHRWCVDRGRGPVVWEMRLDDLEDDRTSGITDAVAAFVERDQPDAIYAPLEIVGVEVQRALISLGVRVPNDVMTATTFDAGRSTAADPPMSTLTFDSAEMGRRAADVLLDLIEGRRSGPITEVVPTRLEPRRSTGAA